MQVNIDAEKVKQYLQSFSDDAKALGLMHERLSSLETKSGSPRTSSLTGLPRGSGDPIDTVGRQLTTLEVLRDAVADAEAQLARKRQRVEAVINILREQGVTKWPEKCNLLSLRYIDCMGWPDVAEILFGDNPRYWDATDTFTRKTFALHRAALEELAEFVTADMLDDYEITGSGH